MTSLGAALRAAVRGEVDDDRGRRAQYAGDASNYRRVPLAVVFPRDRDDVVAAVAVCREQGVPVTCRGGGTSIAGQAIGSGVVLDFSRHLDRVLSVDPRARTCRVEPGIVLDDLQAVLAPHGLRFGPDPSTHSRATIGGMIGNNACGTRSVAWGRTADNVVELEVLTYSGDILTVGAGSTMDGSSVGAALRALALENLELIRTRLGRFPRQVSGYALEHLLPERGFDVARALVGTEGTCVIVLAATLSLVRPPAARALAVLGYPDACAAADAAPGILEHAPLAVEGVDAALVAAARGSLPPPGGGSLMAGGAAPVRLPDGGAWLFVELGGDTPAEAAGRARAVAAGHPAATIVSTVDEQRALWRIREDGAGLATRLPDGSEAWPGWEDAAVPVERLGAYLRGFTALMRRHGRQGIVFGHFGEGCLHVRIDFDLVSPAGVAAFREFIAGASVLVAAHGGSLSGEHGDGQARAEFLPVIYGPDVIGVFERFKAIWDPAGGLNPGMVVRPLAVDDNLRVRPHRTVEVAFGYPADGGDLARAVRRCVGVGKCRSTQPGDVMCPSYRVTRDERDSTRGRARVLDEMLRGDLVVDGWRSTEVRDALDACLSCKGCRSDCPVGVDMATYKAEFLHHHYRRRLRPASHYSMGWLPLWARLAVHAPRAVNAAARSPLLKRLGGIAAEREVPAFAPRTFLRSFRPWTGAAPRGPVLLWADTFNNHFTPHVLHAAADVLTAAGFEVRVAPRVLCCGLTWITTGQLGVARRVARRTLATLEPMPAGTPIVVLEPSCAAALTTDVPELLGDDPRARRVADATVTLAQLLERHDWQPPRLAARSISQTHCHQHAVLGAAADAALLARMGVDDTAIGGCCGLAGNFGFEREHYATSVAVGELALLPAVRAAAPETLVLADGFSCRTQIAQQTGRRARHLAELLRDALRPG